VGSKGALPLDADGRPNFARLHLLCWATPPTLAVHLWAFDLLAFNGRDLRPHPLVKRQACLQLLMDRFGCPAVSHSERSTTAWRCWV
jgi:ATP-dependent DNA ligase